MLPVFSFAAILLRKRLAEPNSNRIRSQFKSIVAKTYRVLYNRIQKRDSIIQDL